MARCSRPQKATYFSSLFPAATLQTREVNFIAFKFFWTPAWLDVLWSYFHSDQTWRAGDTHTELAEQCSKAFSRHEEVQRLIWNNAQLFQKGNKTPLSKMHIQLWLYFEGRLIRHVLTLMNSRRDKLLWQFQNTHRAKLFLFNFSVLILSSWFLSSLSGCILAPFFPFRFPWEGIQFAHTFFTAFNSPEKNLRGSHIYHLAMFWPIFTDYSYTATYTSAAQYLLIWSPVIFTTTS